MAPKGMRADLPLFLLVGTNVIIVSWGQQGDLVSVGNTRPSLEIVLETNHSWDCACSGNHSRMDTNYTEVLRDSLHKSASSSIVQEGPGPPVRHGRCHARSR